ncbi:styrene monooxygenase/indole monooxygenase family protein [Mycobacterium deserti]|uniref:Styrene monooxygenase StyA putative substrate binding domain-containing protein n=1 Tax=Mycobacterium deserti TaxID=2978347 RepID=A0ABT2MHW8_9MYCO|nr:styrene monooxygenase/indole monooxygenase family protein [Mycobacterium deserti]MCT7661862.1 hypothetical protein [Mycobacterium deserti]
MTVASATQETLEQLTLDFDMVFVATGKASFGGLFAVDESRTVFDAPQRHLTQLLIRGVPSVEGQERLYFRFLPEHGEIFMGPILHMSRKRAHTFLIEARPGGDFDRFGDTGNPQDALAVARGIVDDHLAWEPMLKNVELADPLAYLKGAIRPLVRRPVAHLEATGRSVYAVGDVAFVHDPIAGQGGNCTVAYVDHLLSTISKTPSDRLDPDFVEERYEEFWHTQGQFIVGLSVAMVAPPTPALQKILAAAAKSRSVADRVASAFAYPERIAPFLGSEARADEFIASAQGKPDSLNEQEPAAAR